MKKVDKNSIVNCFAGLSKKQNLAFIEVEIFNKLTGSTKSLQMLDRQFILFLFFISFLITLSADITFRILSYFRTAHLGEQKEDKKLIDEEKNEGSFDLAILKDLKKKYFFLVPSIVIFILLICKEKNLPFHMDIRLRNQLISFTRFSENKFLNHLTFSGLSAFSVLFGIVLAAPPVQFSFLVRYASYIKTLTLFITSISILIYTMRGVNGGDYIKKVASNDKEFARRFLSDSITIKKKKDEAKNNFLFSESEKEKIVKFQLEDLRLEGERLILEEEDLILEEEKLTLGEEKLTLKEEKLTLIEEGEALVLKGEALISKEEGPKSDSDIARETLKFKEKALKIHEETLKYNEKKLKLEEKSSMLEEKHSMLEEKSSMLEEKFSMLEESIELLAEEVDESSEKLKSPKASNKKARVNVKPIGRGDIAKQTPPIPKSPIRQLPPRN